MKNVNIETLVSDIKKILINNSTVVELKDLSESSYNQLKNLLGESYEVRGIITLLEKGMDESGRRYTLHISKKGFRD